jgi:hypothetical protein
LPVFGLPVSLGISTRTTTRPRCFSAEIVIPPGRTIAYILAAGSGGSSGGLNNLRVDGPHVVPEPAAGPFGGRGSTFQRTTAIGALEREKTKGEEDIVVVETREARDRELQEIWASDCIRLVRIYQGVIGTPNGQIPIPGISPSRMIDVILNREFPRTTTSSSVSDLVGPI